MRKVKTGLLLVTAAFLVAAVRETSEEETADRLRQRGRYVTSLPGL